MGPFRAKNLHCLMLFRAEFPLAVNGGAFHYTKLGQVVKAPIQWSAGPQGITQLTMSWWLQLAQFCFASIWPIAKIFANFYHFITILGNFQPQFAPFKRFLAPNCFIFCPIFGSDFHPDFALLEQLQYRGAKLVSGALHSISKDKLNKDLGQKSIKKQTSWG